MRLTLIAKSDTGWHQQDLARAARERGIEFDVMDFMNANELATKAQKLGDVVIWRAASGVDLLSERASAALFFGDRPVLNRAVFEQPFITYKYYQQALFAKRAPRFKGITTYRAMDQAHLQRLITKGKLQYPFIVKPNLGSKGKGIIVIEREAQVAELENHRNYVFQNFIKNNGDYRVIVVGGRALGVMRRIAKQGSYLNNISQGATAVNEVRPQVRDAVIEIALSAASAFGLAYCGVDILEDAATGELHFMEVNTAPQWNNEFGFASITGVDVAAAIVDLAIDLADRATTPTATLVQRYYDKHIAASRSKAVHYASRMYLWTGDKRYRDMLNAAEADYIGHENDATEARLRKLFTGEALNRARIGIPARAQYFEKYPELQPANRLLFKSLFARTLYGRDIDATIKGIVSDEQLIALFNKLIHDREAVRVLSTFALNYFYLLKAYFRNDLKLANLVLIEPAFIESLLNEYEAHETMGEISRAERMSLQIYLVTHAIIGESQFYNRAVADKGYQRLLAFAERLIQQNYFDISLDCKVEFLVCCRLTGYRSVLNEVILHEAEKSLSSVGNFLVDVYNTEARAALKNRLTKAEHRSVLFLMASLPFRKAATKPPAATEDKKPELSKRVVGRLAHVDFPDQGIVGVKARVDSGAYFGSVHAADITENADGTLSFKLLGGYHESIEGVRVTVSEYKKRPVKNTTGQYQDRYAVQLRINILGQETMQVVTLADRQNMAAPVLLGRTFLKAGYVVDVSRQFA